MALAATMPETVARRVITKCGGAHTVAGWLEIDASAVRKWLQRGLIPAKHQQPILDEALKRGVALHSSDFFE